MIVGVPKEIKEDENRVALLPVGSELLKRNGHRVLVEDGAGEGSGFANDDYQAAGADVLGSAREVFSGSDMIIKVKEPLPGEYGLLKEDQILFTYFHFASSESLTRAMMEAGIIAIAYETVQKANGELPLLIPMSEVAGRMAVQEGAKYLEKLMGGRGILLGGVPGVEPATVVIIGGGVVGTNAAKMAAGLGARVIIMDINLERLRYLDDIMPKNVITMASDPGALRHWLPHTDLLVGAVLIPGAKAPKLVTRDMVRLMKAGSVIVDVAIDQGGCIETCDRPTTHKDPIYVVDGVIHYTVANMPGAVPFTSTIALTNATLPYAIEIANRDYVNAIKENAEIRKGVNIIHGKVTHRGVAEAFGLDYTPIEEVIT
ncbi:alanine dehydrogenase [candidate division KSB1 bacterium]|nr:alanine dehydrogenase [candidate division KSB1 bacterium]